MLPKTYGEYDLGKVFSPFGELKEIHIIRGPDGSPKGCAFVKFLGKESAMAAIEALNETTPLVRIRFKYIL
jgi:RNA recognition motif-containing protein